MCLEKTVPHKTVQNYEYLLQFSKFTQTPIVLSVPIVDVQIVPVSEIKEVIALNTLYYFANEVLHYIQSNDVILYYYCDITPIETLRNKRNISTQEYRNMLFSTLFERKNNSEFIIENIRIADNENGDHFISLISSKKNCNDLQLLKTEVKRLNK